MLLRALGFAAVAALAVFAPRAAAANDNGNDNDNDDGASGGSVQSTFVAPSGQLAFAMSVPENATDEFYFVLSVNRSIAWGGVGLGTSSMPNALFLIVYESRDGHSVTFSPRLADGHYEPRYWDGFEYEQLDGTIADKEWMTIRARCTKSCLSWPGSEAGIDLNSVAQDAVFAVGPWEGFTSDHPDEGLKFHDQYGAFKINIAGTHGATEAPTLSLGSVNEGVTLESSFHGKHDWLSIMHAVFMILCIVGIMPFGVIILRFGGWVRWHRINQSVALGGVIIGFGLGVATSFRYQRSRGFSDFHQIIGIIVTVFILGQFSLGFLHHKRFKQTRSPTKYGAAHVWVGRGILLIGIMNGFFGLTFALNRRYGLVLAGLIIFICFASLFVIFGRRWLNSRNTTHRMSRQHGVYNQPPPTLANQARRGPFRSTASLPDEDEYLADPPPRYEPPRYEPRAAQQIGLQNVATWRRTTDPKEEGSTNTSGGSTIPREFA